MDVSLREVRWMPLISVAGVLHQSHQTCDRDELVLPSLLPYRTFSLVSPLPRDPADCQEIHKRRPSAFTSIPNQLVQIIVPT
jgi:hypothetical protein